MTGGWMGWRCFEGVLRLELGKEGATICLRGVVAVRELEATTGGRGGGTSRSDFGFGRLSSTLVSLRRAPCCDVEATRGGGGGGLSSFCFAAAGLPWNEGIGNTRLFPLLRPGSGFNAKASVSGRRVEASSGSCTMEGNHGLLVHRKFRRIIDVLQLLYSTPPNHLRTPR